ncbi:MAG: TonB-dependent receptor domain-containing protein, partial [Terriglobales bacterium]
EWNNPYTKMFGDQASVETVLPGNTVDGGGFLIHTQYNSHNNFYNPADGGSKLGVANIGGKIRSSFFTTDLYAGYVQDRIRPWSWLEVSPGIRYYNNAVGYADHTQQDFAFAPGVVAPSHCLLKGAFTSTPGNITIQSAACDAMETRGGFEPSLNLAINPRPWLSLYGGYSEELKAPQLGGGGGFFQGVDPATYHLARAEYAQGGFKVHFERLGPMARLLAGASYFHLFYAGQEQDIGLANGDTISASATSAYRGVNAFTDVDATQKLHLFLNGTVERAQYSSYVVGESIDSQGVLQPGSIPFSGLPVPYVPQSLLNLGAYYTVPLGDVAVIQPRVWYQYTGTQTIFDNSLARPSTQAMASFGTLNLGANIPLSRFNLRLTAMNVTNRRYNQFVYISAGNYFATPTGGYALAYPGSPFTFFGTFSVRF